MSSEDPAAWEPYADYIYHLQNAVIMLPARGPGRVYRGIDKRMSSRVYSGNITWQAFSSTTYNPMSMAPFCGLDQDTYAITGTIFVIDLKGSRSCRLLCAEESWMFALCLCSPGNTAACLFSFPGTFPIAGLLPPTLPSHARRRLCCCQTASSRCFTSG